MSTNESQVNTVVEPSSTQTPVILKDNENYTVLLSDLQRFVDPINQLLKPEKQLNKVTSISDLTQALTKENLRLKDKTIELNPILDEINSITVDFNDETEEEKAKYLGYNSIIVKTKPLENKIIPMLTLQMLTQTDYGYVIEKSSDDFCGMAQVEIQDIALASNLEYTITPADLTNYTDGVYTLDFKFTGNRSSENIPFENFPDDVKELYTDSTGNSIVFGAKDLTINVPLVEYHEFTVDSKTLGKTFTPADVPPSLDGTGGNAGKIGFKKIKVKANLKSTITADTLVADARAGGGKVYSAGSADAESGNEVDGLGIGYPAVEIPPITTAYCSLPLRYNYNLADIAFFIDQDRNLDGNASFAGYDTPGLPNYQSSDCVFAVNNATINKGHHISQIRESNTLFSNLLDAYTAEALYVSFNTYSPTYSYDSNGEFSSFDYGTNLFSVVTDADESSTVVLVDQIVLPFPSVNKLELRYSDVLQHVSNGCLTSESISSYLSECCSQTGESFISALKIQIPFVVDSNCSPINVYDLTQTFKYQLNSSNTTASVEIIDYINSYSSSWFTDDYITNPLENYTIELPGLTDTHFCMICVASCLTQSSVEILTVGETFNIPCAFENLTAQVCVKAVCDSSNLNTNTVAIVKFDSKQDINNISIYWRDSAYDSNSLSGVLGASWNKLTQNSSADSYYQLDASGCYLSIHCNNVTGTYCTQPLIYYITTAEGGTPT